MQEKLVALLIGYAKVKRSSKTQKEEDEVPNPCAVFAAVYFLLNGNVNDNDNDKEK